MRFFQRLLVVAAVLGLMAWPAIGQTTGALTGRVIHQDAPLPGVTVTVSSPAMQGQRTAYTDANGNYNFGALPPGEYTVNFTMEGMSSVVKTVRVGLEQTARADANLGLSAVAEAITVTASAPAVVETTEVTSNYSAETVDELPIARTVNGIILMAAGATNNGPRGAIQISGGFSHDNLIMVNGAVIQENLRGQTHTLFIEDAIQETTVMTGGISAEFGRFTGGVVNSITKSGGNEFSGSFRDTFTDPSWTNKTDFPGDVEKESVLNETYEATLGGRIIRDRLWFFLAGRFFETSFIPAGVAGRYAGAGPDISVDQEQLRYEVKLTGAITPKHTLWGSFLDSPLESTNNVQLGVWEPSGIDPSIEQANDFLAARYNGILTNNWLLEVGYAEKTFEFIGFGGEDQNIITGTPLIVWRGGNNPLTGVANEAYFCGSCGNESRNNENFTVKTTYYLGTQALGTHNIVAGYDDWSESRNSNNFQSPTNFTVWLYGLPATRNPDGSVTYHLTSGVDQIEYYPIEFPSAGSDLTTLSFFVNDKWDFNEHFSFNLGARYDKNDATDSFNQPIAKDSAISPRVGLTYDPAGNGRLRFNANYGQYVGRLAEGPAGSGSPAGNPHYFAYVYGGDDFSGSAEATVRQAITWFQQNGFLDREPDAASVGGVSTRIVGADLDAPDMEEFTGGVGMQLTSRGYIRADYINRDWNNYYVAITNTSTGIVTEPRTGARFDFTRIENTNLLDRKYEAVQLSGQYRPLNWLDLGANYTWSTLEGNAEGENVGSGPITESGWIFTYPEYTGFAQNRPTGYLSGDQRHKARVWATVDIPLGGFGNVNISGLHRYDSGLPYSAVGNIDVRPFITNPGYVTPPASAATVYYFSERGQFRFDDINATDFAVNYTVPIGPVQLFAQGEVFNTFNEQGLIAGQTTVFTRASGNGSCPGQGGTTNRCLAFNPFTETPVEGVHYRLHPSFGQANATTAFQEPRRYQFSVGLRF
jgi:outer membrane receptor protein involved in Fe transport